MIALHGGGESMEHLETIKLVPLPGNEELPTEHLEIELMRDGSVLILKTADNTSFGISKEETVKLIAALQRGLKSEGGRA
jgi:hypothetical protein